jgi:hypothetical protein
LRRLYIIESLLSLQLSNNPRLKSRKKNSDEPYFFDGGPLFILFLGPKIHGST